MNPKPTSTLNLLEERWGKAWKARAGAARIALVTTFLLSIVGLATAATAGASSRIVWTRNAAASPRAQIVSARPDGRQLRELTHPKKHDFDIDAQISPDGRRVVLERDSESAVKSVVVGAGGHNKRTLDLGCVDPCALDSAPTWLATDRLAFTRIVGPFDGPNNSARSGALQSARLDGSDRRRLSERGIDGKFEDYHAHLSPDGRYVVFTRVRDDPLAVAAFRMNVDGSRVRQLTPWKLGGDLADISPATSGPTKDLVVFETYGMGAPKGKNQNLATVPSTCRSLNDCGKHIKYLTEHGAGRVASFNPAWSPNGNRIAYTLFKGPDHDHPCCVGNIWTMRADGSHRKAVSKSPRFEYRPDWGPAR
jgi:Tol biopolymer transport system component